MRLIAKSMKPFSKIKWGLIARFAWVFCSVSFLYLGLGTFMVEPNGSVVPNLLLSLVILLSFPSGLVVFLLAWPFIDINPAADFCLLWLVVALVGYFQWFNVVPNLAGGIITLSLGQAQPIANASDIGLKNPALHKTKISRKSAVRIRHFDTAGRSPLERAIKFTSQRSSSRFTAP
jgi:hypothetical protein